uniref:Uncharacterized protein n=1 Tax=Nelumbo nucifera TaxID=4432 RepID=A0A822YU02_NELNU|nr:TPA_asm: hypothetical protein HUJ06_006223 [Nelumbo nucifera]
MASKRNLRSATTAKEIQQKFVAVVVGGSFSPSPVTCLTSVPSGRSLSGTDLSASAAFSSSAPSAASANFVFSSGFRSPAGMNISIGRRNSTGLIFGEWVTKGADAKGFRKYNGRVWEKKRIWAREKSTEVYSRRRVFRKKAKLLLQKMLLKRDWITFN